MSKMMAVAYALHWLTVARDFSGDVSNFYAMKKGDTDALRERARFMNESLENAVAELRKAEVADVNPGGSSCE